MGSEREYVPRILRRSVHVLQSQLQYDGITVLGSKFIATNFLVT
jgi:hypothetical protein